MATVICAKKLAKFDKKMKTQYGVLIGLVFLVRGFNFCRWLEKYGVSRSEGGMQTGLVSLGNGTWKMKEMLTQGGIFT